MKEAVVLVLVAVLVVGAIGIYMANSGSLSLFSSQPQSVQPLSEEAKAEEAAKEAKEAKEAVDAKKKATAPRKAEKKAPAAVAAEAVAPPAPDTLLVQPVATVVVAPPVPKQFPDAREIPVGAERENIAERFGQPSLATTTTSDDGRVLETLVYSRKSGRAVTVIRIEDGKVLSAYSR